MSTMTEAQREKLIVDLRNVIHDAEELLRMSANDAGVEAKALHDRVRSRLVQAKDSLVQVQQAAIDRAKAAGQKADSYVHDNPWSSIGIAAGVGVLIGLLIGRR